MSDEVVCKIELSSDDEESSIVILKEKIKVLSQENQKLRNMLTGGKSTESTLTLESKVKSLTDENNHLRNVITSIDTYQKVFARTDELLKALENATEFITTVREFKLSSTRDSITFTKSNNLLSTIKCEDTQINERVSEFQSVEMLDNCSKTTEEFDDFMISHNPDQSNVSLEDENESHHEVNMYSFQNNNSLEFNNSETEDSHPPSIVIDEKRLSACSLSSASKYANDLMAMLFTEHEMATSSITGRLPNFHKHRNKGEIREKKPLNPEKLKFLRYCIESKFPDCDDKKITRTIQGKLKYESAKKFGVGYKRERR